MPPFRTTPRTPRQRLGATLAICALLLFIGYYLLDAPLATLIVLSALAVATVMAERRRRHQLRRLAVARAGHSIAEFCAAFDMRVVDPWIVRAVFEQIQAYLEGSYHQFPVHADDRLVQDLQIDDDDLAFDIAEQVAQRTGRSIELAASSPRVHKVSTAGDVVDLFNRLPKV